MKNVLVIVYYFPPMGGSGVQRPLKFVKYLREFGWNPIILCPEPGAYHTFDESLEKELLELNVEVHRVPGNTPLHKVGNRSIKLPVWLELKLRRFSTLFWIPDNKIGWIKTGFLKAKEIIKKDNIDLIFTTAPPYSNLILGKQIKEEFNIPLVMDLRDDWLESHLLSYPSKWHYSRMKKLEMQTLSEANQLITINSIIADSLDSRLVNKANTIVIPHGFDPDDFNEILKQKTKLKTIKFLYSGTFYPESGPEVFLEAISIFINKNPKYSSIIELQFQGTITNEQLSLFKQFNLKKQSELFGYVSHRKAIENIQNADVLWLNNAHKKNSNALSLGKTYEYLASRKPILALIPEGDISDTLKEYDASFICAPNDVEEVVKKIEEIILLWESKKLPTPNLEFINKFNRKELTSELATIFNNISES